VHGALALFASRCFCNPSPEPIPVLSLSLHCSENCSGGLDETEGHATVTHRAAQATVPAHPEPRKKQQETPARLWMFP